MSARFFALPVNGDAFLCMTGDRTFMVDAGSGRARIQDLLRRHFGGLRLDVLVCTHNDSDHAKGVRGVLRDPTCQVGEIWLPVEFLETLEESRRLGVEGTIDLLRQVTRDPSLEADLDRDDPPATDDATGDPAPLAHVDAALALHAMRLSRSLEHAIGPSMLGSPFGNVTSGFISVRDAAAALANIANIASEAAINNVPVVWLRHFEHGLVGRPYSAYGLTALDATRIASTRRRPLLRSLYLTAQNRRALVLRAAVDGTNDVLFCSDSALTFQTAPFTGVGLFTAPHHGSPSNDAAYAVLPATSALVVRSDHERPATDSTPSATYLACRPRTRCTLCRGRARPGDVVEAALAVGGWTFVAPTRACRC